MELKLSSGLVALIDAADAWVCEGNRWVADWRGENCYVSRNIKRKKQYLHRLLANPGPGECVDHINGNTLDNRRSNLRCCSRQQNAWNGKSRKPKSGHKGVVAHHEKWSARLTINGKNLYLGLYSSPTEAALAYNEAAVQHFGEFARLNVI